MMGGLGVEVTAPWEENPAPGRALPTASEDFILHSDSWGKKKDIFPNTHSRARVIP